MILYFDSENKVNLHHIDIIKTIRDFDQWKSRINHKKLTIKYTKEYKEKGIYPIEISKLTHQWLCKSFNLIEKIPDHVIKATQENKLRIMIMAVVEGDSFIKSNNDAFMHLTDAVEKLRLPTKSVVIISGNLKAEESYKRWCKKNKRQPCVEFIKGLDYWDGKGCGWQIADGVNINGATDHFEYPAPFNSLNRAHRPHRTDHLYLLAKLGMLEKSLVSGGAFFKEQRFLHSTYINVDQKDFTKVLDENYPKTLDFENNNLRKTNPANHINQDIYNKSLLTVVTETEFESDDSLFFSEKVFKPISMGHPFMVLGSRGFIKGLKEFGFHADFKGIDMRYDEIADPKERFIQFHKSLESWYNMSLKAKKSFGRDIWRTQIIDNWERFKEWDVGKEMMQQLLDSTVKYFLDKR